MGLAVENHLAAVGYCWIYNLAPYFGKDCLFVGVVGPFAGGVNYETALGGVCFEGNTARY